MTRDDIIKMAREAGWQYADGDDGYNPLWRFADLVAAAEREECAKVCEQPIDEIQITDDCSELVYMDSKECAAAIRARGQNV